MALRRRLSAGMEEAKQCVTHRPNFGEKQLNRIGGALSRGSQCHLLQPFREWLSRPFGGRFHLSQFVPCQPHGDGFCAEKLGLLSSPDVGLFACTVVVWKASAGNLPADLRIWPRISRSIRTFAKLFRFSMFTLPRS